MFFYLQDVNAGRNNIKAVSNINKTKDEKNLSKEKMFFLLKIKRTLKLLRLIVVK